MAIETGGLILVTAATGNTGFCTTKLLLKDNQRVRAGCFVGSEKGPLLEGLHPESIVCYDANDAGSLALLKAFEGVDAAFIIPSRSPNRVQHVKNYCEAAKRAGVKFLLLFSMLTPPDSTQPYAQQYKEIEDIV